MFKDTIEYEDYDGNARKATIYCNLSKAELIKMEAEVGGGFGEYLKKIASSDDMNLVMNTFIDIIKKSYGIKSEDGNRFIKSDEIVEEFMQTEAYSEFLWKLCTDVDYSSLFAMSIVPKMSSDVAPVA